MKRLVYGIAIAAILAIAGLSAIVRFRHPELTETQLLLFVVNLLVGR